MVTVFMLLTAPISHGFVRSNFHAKANMKFLREILKRNKFLGTYNIIGYTLNFNI